MNTYCTKKQNDKENFSTEKSTFNGFTFDENEKKIFLSQSVTKSQVLFAKFHFIGLKKSKNKSNENLLFVDTINNKP